MKLINVVLTIAVVGVSLAACGASHTSVIGGGEPFYVRDGKVVLTRSGGPDAEIAADGAFSIGQQPVTVTDAQRATLASYHAGAKQFMADVTAVAKAGAAVGTEAASAVARGLAAGDTSKIGAEVEAKAAGVEQAAAKLCDDAQLLQSLQTTLVATLESFRPYAGLHHDEANKCHRELGARQPAT